MQVLQSQAGPLAQRHVWVVTSSTGRCPMQGRSPHPAWGRRSRSPTAGTTLHCGDNGEKDQSTIQSIPLLCCHKSGSEKQHSAGNWEPQLSLNPSAGKHAEVQAKEGRKWDYLKSSILKGMATDSGLWPKSHWLVHCGAARGQDGTTSWLTASEQSRGCCKQDFGLQGGVWPFGTKTDTLGTRHDIAREVGIK